MTVRKKLEFQRCVNRVLLNQKRGHKTSNAGLCGCCTRKDEQDWRRSLVKVRDDDGNTSSAAASFTV
jgi:hypothetical protein